MVVKHDLTLRDEQCLRKKFWEYMNLRNRKQEGDKRKLHNEQLHNLPTSPNIIRTR
jgi:hypothetical protein